MCIGDISRCITQMGGHRGSQSTGLCRILSMIAYQDGFPCTVLYPKYFTNLIGILVGGLPAACLMAWMFNYQAGTGGQTGGLSTETVRQKQRGYSTCTVSRTRIL